jgi:glycosyltransferase involved in cell wall biosynthesis
VRGLVIIPAYNESLNIGPVISEIRQHFGGDVSVIDDGSSDATGAIARKAGAIVLRHPCNLGIGAAVQTGFLYAIAHDYDIVLRLDADGQHDPSYIPRFVDALQHDSADIIVGSRFLGRRGYQSTVVRRAGIVILNIVSALVGTRTTDPTSGYWAVNRRALQVLANSKADDYPETESLVMASRAGCRVAELPVLMRPRTAGESSIGAINAGYYMIKVVLSLLIERLRPR